jgi:hypothetical protein
MKRFNPKVGDLVYMRWDDHCSYTNKGWQAMSSVKDTLVPRSICETVGFVVDVTPAAVTTSASLSFQSDGDDNVGQVSTRLRNNITHAKVIARFPRPKDA